MTLHDDPAPVVRPLPGPGLAARAGDLLLVCADGPGAEELLGLLDEVAAAGGDGAMLVRRTAVLLAVDPGGRPGGGDPDAAQAGCAVSGPSVDGRLAVLAHGVALVRVSGAGGEITLSGADAITSADRLVAGPITQVRLELPGAGPADPRWRLDAGVVGAAGLLCAYSGSPQSRMDTFAAALAPVGRADAASAGTGSGGTVAGSGSAIAAAGMLVLDDGSAYALDADYVLGREPQQDPDVLAGTARPLRIADADGVISRRHARVARVGDQVHFMDLGSANGSMAQFPGDAEPRPLVAHEPVVLHPGTQITLGRRRLRYEAPGGTESADR